MKAVKERVGAVIPAAGDGRRMDGVDKVLALLAGEPVLVRVVNTFQECDSVDQIVVVLSEPNLERGRQLVDGWGWSKVSDVCSGGRRRRDSVAVGLKLLTKCDWVVVHDGARPLVTAELIERGLAAARDTGVAVAAVPVTDTIKVVGGEGIVRQTPPRQNLWAIQTPQIFRSEIITEGYSRSNGDVTDDASLVETLGYPVKIYAGSYDNIKITTPDDLALAEVLWQKRGR